MINEDGHVCIVYICVYSLYLSVCVYIYPCPCINHVFACIHKWMVKAFVHVGCTSIIILYVG